MRIYVRTRNTILYYINLINLSDKWRSPNKKIFTKPPNILKINHLYKKLPKLPYNLYSPNDIFKKHIL